MNVGGGLPRGMGRRGCAPGRRGAPTRPSNRSLVGGAFSLGNLTPQLNRTGRGRGNSNLIFDSNSTHSNSRSSKTNGSTARVSSMGSQGIPFFNRSATISIAKSNSTESSAEKNAPAHFALGKDTRIPSKLVTPQNENIRSGGRTTSSRSRVTPGSTISNTTAPDSKIIVAITEGRGAAKGEVGIAAIDLKRPHLILCQLSDTHSYIHSLTKLNYFNPAEIIVPHTFNGSVMSELYRLIRDHFPKVNLISFQRRCFSDSAGSQYIKELSAPEYSNIQLQLVHKFYALTAVSALLKYVEHVQCVHFAPHSLKIEYHSSQNSTLIDVETCARLELVESLSDSSNQKYSLLSILNYTYTSGGLRSLRANLLQPPSDKNIINCRLDCIDELLQNNEGLLPALKRVMKQFYDVDKILWLCMLLPVQDGLKSGEAQLNQTLQLKATMDSLPGLIDALQMAKGRWFHKIKKDLEDTKFKEISERIRKVIQDDVHAARGPNAHFQRCFAVRPNINGLLDVARKSYSELISDIQEKVTGLADAYRLPLRLNHNTTKGFHVAMSTGPRGRSKFNPKDLPSIFFEVQNHGNTVTMTTEEIVLLDQQAKETLNEIQTMSNIIISGLLTDLRNYMSVLYVLCEHVAELDMVLSLAQASSSSNYVRPIFNDYLELKDSIHPILECVLPIPPIPNDVFASPELNFNIITGPNMGGKSIYIKQIALLQIMAQIGCFVPATKAVFRIADNIFSRIGFNDSIECNASTYVLEMKEMQYIMKTMTPSSLVIIDELCRGTSSEEATSMAWAICEYLLNTKAFIFFTTHFLYLTRLEDVYYNVTNLHTDTGVMNGENDQPKSGLIYKYKIVKGTTNIDHYGLTLAKNTNLPKNVLALAEELIGVISKQKKPLPKSNFEDKSDFNIYKLAASIIHVTRKVNKSALMYTDLIDNFKRENPRIMEKLNLEDDNSVDDIIEGNCLNDEMEMDEIQINDQTIQAIVDPRNEKKLNENSFQTSNPPKLKSNNDSSFLFNAVDANYIAAMQNVENSAIEEEQNCMFPVNILNPNTPAAINKQNIIVLENDTIPNRLEDFFADDLAAIPDNMMRNYREFAPKKRQNNVFGVLSVAKRQTDDTISAYSQDGTTANYFGANLSNLQRIIGNRSGASESGGGNGDVIDYESIFCEPDVYRFDEGSDVSESLCSGSDVRMS